ncbi:T9SS type A sorting domain-containing protein [Sphingobacterium sp. Mn56C]|uniref:T9SS type A sorting domain-containing protein n=1 Tax=Sphingobacterium sp. Mn56C TaxID=3395261 RepID=UPI003BD80D15
MQNVILKSTRYILSSMLMLGLVLSAVAGGKVSATPHFTTAIADAKAEDVEKIINNVKAMYNPVASQITVSFKLSKQSPVSIKLMDALGNEVLNLSNSTIDAGVQNLSFDTDGKVSPGFYFVRVSSGSETVVKRVSIR